MDKTKAENALTTSIFRIVVEDKSPTSKMSFADARQEAILFQTNSAKLQKKMIAEGSSQCGPDMSSTGWAGWRARRGRARLARSGYSSS